MLQDFIIAMVIIGAVALMGVYVLGNVTSNFGDSTAFNTTSYTMNALSSISSWIPFMLALMVGTIILALFARLVTGPEEEKESDNKPAEIKKETPQPYHRQTYLEYVKERIEAQKLIHNV